MLLAIAAFAVALTCIVLAALDSRIVRQSELYEADSHPGRHRTAGRQLVDSNH